ncbi:MAG: hypothetical protein WBY94_20150 [Polyangiaceae bacterium]
MSRRTAALAAWTLGAAFVGGLSACEALLSVGGLSDRRASGSGAGGDDATANETADDASGGVQDTFTEEAATSLPDSAGQLAPSGDDAPSPVGDSEAAVGEAGQIGEAGQGDTPDEAGPLDAGGTSGSEDAGGSPDSASPIADANGLSDAPRSLEASADSGSPPGPCATGAKVIVMSKSDMSVAFGTLGAVCVKFAGTVSGWNASNVQGRSATVVGSTMQVLATIPEGRNQPAIGPGGDGFIYWNFTSGMYTYAAMFAFE